MRVDEITVFVNVLEAGSFVGAARRLRMPTTTVSAKIAALERRLGFTLIRRTTRRLRATAEGQVYFDRCRAVLREFETVEEELRAASAGMGGRLRLTASVDIAQTLLPPVIAAFREAYPAIGVELVVTDSIVDLVAEGIDLAVRVGPLRDSSLIARAFVTGPSGLFASRAYIDLRGAPSSLNELAEHDLIGIAKPWAQPLSMLQGDRKVVVDLSSALTCNDLLTVRSLVALGLGISFLPGYLAHQLDLVRVLPELNSPYTGLYFAYPAQKFVPLRVRAFMDFAVSSVKRQGLHP